MSKIGVGVASQWYQEKRHKEAVERKYTALKGKQALLTEWELRNDPDDHDYILSLRAKVRSLRCQLTSMRPDSDEEL